MDEGDEVVLDGGSLQVAELTMSLTIRLLMIFSPTFEYVNKLLIWRCGTTQSS